MSAIEHAKHNEEVCEYLNNHPDKKCLDWVITTAFYSALHYCDHKIFPLSLKKGDKTTIFNCFEEYCALTGKTRGKHQERTNLIEQYLSEVIDNYNSLKDASWTARYNDYQATPALANWAIKKLQEIKLT